MRDALHNEEPTNNISANLRSAALISFILVLPLAILESLNNTITKQNAPGLIVLFGLLWLLPLAFIVILLPIVRTVRAGGQRPGESNEAIGHDRFSGPDYNSVGRYHY